MTAGQGGGGGIIFLSGAPHRQCFERGLVSRSSKWQGRLDRGLVSRSSKWQDRMEGRAARDKILSGRAPAVEPRYWSLASTRVSIGGASPLDM